LTTTRGGYVFSTVLAFTPLIAAVSYVTSRLERSCRMSSVGTVLTESAGIRGVGQKSSLRERRRDDSLDTAVEMPLAGVVSVLTASRSVSDPETCADPWRTSQTSLPFANRACTSTTFTVPSSL
jgi:hypothetical protein